MSEQVQLYRRDLMARDTFQLCEGGDRFRVHATQPEMSVLAVFGDHSAGSDRAHMNDPVYNVIRAQPAPEQRIALSECRVGDVVTDIMDIRGNLIDALNRYGGATVDKQKDGRCHLKFSDGESTSRHGLSYTCRLLSRASQEPVTVEPYVGMRFGHGTPTSGAYPYEGELLEQTSEGRWRWEWKRAPESSGMVGHGSWLSRAGLDHQFKGSWHRLDSPRIVVGQRYPIGELPVGTVVRRVAMEDRRDDDLVVSSTFDGGVVQPSSYADSAVISGVTLYKWRTAEVVSLPCEVSKAARPDLVKAAAIARDMDQRGEEKRLRYEAMQREDVVFGDPDMFDQEHESRQWSAAVTARLKERAWEAKCRVTCEGTVAREGEFDAE